jgi:mRNA-degrading endonuclease RelE of RelBE toxin-antitoxin system
LNSRTTPRFREILGHLPAELRAQASATFILWEENPDHPSLNFKPVGHSNPRAYSVRISLQYRAIGLKYDDEIRWVWVGPHADYDQELKKYR